MSEDDALRVRYKGGDPLEGGKIAESEPVELFSAAHNIEKQQRRETGESDRAGEAAASDEGRDQSQQHQPQLQRTEENRAFEIPREAQSAGVPA
nr:seed maturation protein [Ipomoea batatas]